MRARKGFTLTGIMLPPSPPPFSSSLEGPESNLLVNGGGGALELLDEVGNVFLDDLLVGGSAHFAENMLRVLADPRQALQTRLAKAR